jgi:glutaredoxin 2
MDIEYKILKNEETREKIKAYIANKGVGLTVKNISKGMGLKRKLVKYLLRSDKDKFTGTSRTPYSVKKRYVWSLITQSLHSDTVTDTPSNE